MFRINMLLGSKPYNPAVRVHLIHIMLRIPIYFGAILILSPLLVPHVDADSHLLTCSLEKSMIFENWKEWKQVTTGPVVSKGHSSNWVGIFVDKLAEPIYLSASSPYQVCSKIVKPIYTDSSGSNVRKLTIMVKMPEGYDPENSDWWYGVYDATGMKAQRQGKLLDCIPCHKLAAETDYLYSKEVVNAEQE